ncbi:tRNA (adenine(58)-N(1))-methyltransferase non-catalytic subunit trm6 isoform X2 [Ananas comosus]|uniref:tRNA (adenine(58)-N(1))-methyltransferase non-catalytic subunit TRM6 n=1 Tax=Ananas comosus TaxID=4615 RepID=A0A6P5EPX1_ANACO|nr:tRNA (adenine(58)-N(1))-methyltransferase non-catalytic subunit trm6 isoform X2 [Ananas comosus]
MAEDASTATSATASAATSAAAAAASPIPRLAWEGCSVLLDANDGDRLVFARLSPAATLKIGNKKCSLAPLVGCPFGSSFRVESGPNGPFLDRFVPSTLDNCAQDIADGQLTDDQKDNRSLVDNNTAQSLSSDDIDTMRREGATGDKIIEALIANSSTFGKKTAFSQEKYKIKKQKKYAPKVLLRRPSTRSICETYFKKHPARTGFLRVDTLSLLLSMANVGAYSDVLVVDMVGGLLTGAIAERLGDEKADRASSNEPFVQEEDSLLECGDEDNIPAIQKSIKPGKQPSPETIKYWKENGFSSLIVAAPESKVGKLVTDLLPLLAYSAPFAIYHQYLQPLATCMHKLQTSRMAVGLQISEPWLREYQILPSRTHPHMQMNAFGGYILSGTRICSSEAFDGIKK